MCAFFLACEVHLSDCWHLLAVMVEENQRLYASPQAAPETAPNIAERAASGCRRDGIFCLRFTERYRMWKPLALEHQRSFHCWMHRSIASSQQWNRSSSCAGVVGASGFFSARPRCAAKLFSLFLSEMDKPCLPGFGVGNRAFAERSRHAHLAAIHVCHSLKLPSCETFSPFLHLWLSHACCPAATYCSWIPRKLLVGCTVMRACVRCGGWGGGWVVILPADLLHRAGSSGPVFYGALI